MQGSHPEERGPAQAAFSYERWHENFLRLILISATPLGLVVAVIAIVDVVHAGTPDLAYIYGAAWLVLFGITVRRPPYHVRAWTLLALTYFIGISGLVENGMRGDARLFFFGLTIMTAMLVDIRAALFVAAAGVLTVAVIGGLAFGGVVRLMSKVTPLGSPELWVVSTLTLALLETMVLMGLYLFLREFTSAQDQVRRSLGALEAERTLLRTVIDNIPDAVYSKDASGRRQLVNRADAALLGKARPEEALGMTGAEPLSEKDAARLLADDRAVLSGGEPLINREISLAGPDGQVRWMLESKLPLRSPSGEIVGLVGIDRDITDRRRGEQERSRLENELRLSQRLEAMGRLAGGLAHDINNLLTPILGYAQLLLEGPHRGNELTDGLEQIKSAAVRARDLAHQLLVFGRQQDLCFQPVDLREVVRRFDKLLRGMVREDIRLEIRLPDGLAQVQADVNAVEQVIMNLVLNAQEAMPSAGTLVIELADEALDAVRVRGHPGLTAGPYVVVRVMDTGVGMDASTASRIFEPFFTTKQSGTGLGLSTVYGLVRQHGGSIEVSSRPGKGTTFTIFLPVSRPLEEATAIDALSSSDAPRGTETVLVVDDAQPVREVVTQALARLGYRVHAASGGAEALRIASRTPVDLLVSDVVMPEMDGAELSARMRDLRAGIKTLFITGYTSDLIVHRGVPPHVPILRKPFLLEDLAREVRRTLDQSPDVEGTHDSP